LDGWPTGTSAVFTTGFEITIAGLEVCARNDEVRNAVAVEISGHDGKSEDGTGRTLKASREGFVAGCDQREGACKRVAHQSEILPTVTIEIAAYDRAQKKSWSNGGERWIGNLYASDSHPQQRNASQVRHRQIPIASSIQPAGRQGNGSVVQVDLQRRPELS
jgi:hypothetical protein